MVNLNLAQLPCRIKALSIRNDDDSYTIILNSKLNQEQQIESYKHEIKHIENNDFNKSNIDRIEYYAHKRD